MSCSEVAQQFLQFLLAQRKFAEAAELCPKLLKASQSLIFQPGCGMHDVRVRLPIQALMTWS